MNSKLTRLVSKLWIKWLDVCVWCILRKIKLKSLISKRKEKYNG